jgi:hypothetical protein
LIIAGWYTGLRGMDVAPLFTILSFCIFLMVGGMLMGANVSTSQFAKFLAGAMEVVGRVVQESNSGGEGGISTGGRW